MAEVRELGFGKRDRKRFLEVEFALNRDDPLWVPPLRMDRMKYFDPGRNPFFEHAEVAHFVAVSGGRDVGRVAAIRNRMHEEIHEEPVGFFGFLETVEDAEVLGALLDTASGWLRERGLETMRGPTSYDLNETAGALVDAFDLAPTFLMPYNRAFLPPMLEAAGFTKAKDLLTYRVDPPNLTDKIRRLSDRLRKREGVETRGLDMTRFREEVHLVREIYNGAWEKNWGFTPLTERELDAKVSEMKQVVVPELVIFASLGGRVGAFAMCLPNLNEALIRLRNGRLFPFGFLKLMRGMKRIRRVRVVTLGVLPRFRKRGLELLLIRELFDRSHALGYPESECSWVLEDNEMMKKGILAAGGYVERTHRIYERPVT